MCRSLPISLVGNYMYDELRSSRGPARNVVISIDLVPSQGAGPDSLGVIAGKVSGIGSPSQFRVAVYAFTDHWYVQPTRDGSLTLIDNEGNWKTATHLGTSYAALLVNSEFSPPVQPSFLPRGNDVLAQATVGATFSP